MACALEAASTPPPAKRIRQHQGHGFLYEGSPLSLSSSALFETAKKEGSRIFKGSVCETDHPSPNSIYFSHRKKHLDTLAELGTTKDVDGILSLLNGKQQLSTSEQVIKVLGESVKELKEELEELKEEKEELKEELDVVKQLGSLGTSSLILVFDCLKGLESKISKIYQKRICSIPSDVNAKFGQIVKDFQRLQNDGMVKKTRGSIEEVCKKIGMITFSAALYHFVHHFSQYNNMTGKEKFSNDAAQGKEKFSNDAAQTLARPLLNFYRDTMKEFIGEFQDANDSLQEFEGGFNSLQEWHALYMLRIQRDHHGGHCASWRDGYPNEGDRLRKVKRIFEELMHRQSQELKQFHVLKKFVVPSLESYIAKKEAAAGASASRVDDGVSDQLDCEWLQAWA